MTNTLRIIEFVALFGLVPVVLIYTEDIFPLIPTLLVLMGIVIVALRIQGWQYRELWILGPAREWRNMLLLFLAQAPFVAAVAYYYFPDDFFAFPREVPLIWLMVMVLYPLLSAFPQEVFYRLYLFRRFGDWFTSSNALIVVSALLFAFGHIMFMNWVAILATFFGGLVFAWRYQRSGSIVLATIEHGIYGNFFFTVGFGQFIFSGAV